MPRKNKRLPVGGSNLTKIREELGMAPKGDKREPRNSN